MPSALSIRVRGIVGVGFCSFVYRLAHTHKLAGWVLNGEGGVQIFLEGENARLDAFLPDLRAQAPPAARISEIDTTNVEPKGFHGFTIRESERRDRPTVRISPDLPVCDECVTELFDPSNPRHQYPYINCTNCGPRYSVILSLPHDRCNTTMKSWLLDEYCSTEYHNPPVAASTLSPWPARSADQTLSCARNTKPDVIGQAAIQKAAEQLRSGGILDAVIHGSRRTVPTKTSISSTGFIVDENSSGCTKSILLQCSLYPLGHIMWFFTRVA